MYFAAGSIGLPSTVIVVTREPGGCLMSASKLSPETTGKRPEPCGAGREPVLDRVLHVLAGDLDHHGRIAEGQFAQHVAAGQLVAGGVLLVGADAAGIGDGELGAGRGADRVGDQIADRRLLRADHAGAGVERGGERRDLDIEFLRQLRLVALDEGGDLRIRRRGAGIVDAEGRRPGDLAGGAFAAARSTAMSIAVT